MSNPPRLPETFNRLAWSNLAAQSAEQIALAAAPIVAVLTLGVAEGQTGLLQTALTLPFVLFAIPAGLLADPLPPPRRPAGRPHLPPFADGGRRGAAGRGPCSDRAAARARRAQSAAAGAARLCRRLRHRRLQRGRAGVGAVAGEFGPVAGGQCADRACTHHRLRQRPCARRRAGRGVGRELSLRLLRRAVRER